VDVVVRGENGRMVSDESWMRLALGEAARGVGLTSPNPPVGAVLVSDGREIGRGWHRRAGGAHAEIEALRDAEARGLRVRGATCYVSLEPCSTSGRTPPCVGALIEAGVARVVWAVDDPDPRHEGRARALLVAAGIEVDSGVCGELGGELVAAWGKWVRTGWPWVVAKAGVTMDGRIQRPPWEGRWITSEASREHAMGLRAAADAVLVGGGTARADRPSLTVRGASLRVGKVQPWRVVWSQSGELGEGSPLLSDEYRDRTLVRGGAIGDVLGELGGMGVVRVLAEGGNRLMGALLGERQVDELWVYRAPVLALGGLPFVGGLDFEGGAGSLGLRLIERAMIGGDEVGRYVVTKKGCPA